LFHYFPASPGKAMAAKDEAIPFKQVVQEIERDRKRCLFFSRVSAPSAPANFHLRTYAKDWK
jgi:hypothetical protein